MAVIARSTWSSPALRARLDKSGGTANGRVLLEFAASGRADLAHARPQCHGRNAAFHPRKSTCKVLGRIRSRLQLPTHKGAGGATLHSMPVTHALVTPGCLQERVGKTGDGGKWVCGLKSLLQHSACVVYSAGSDGEPSFEQAVAKSTACEIHVFDHTLDAAQAQFVRSVPSVRLHSTGLAAEGTGAGANMRTLSDVLDELQHQWVDVLKMDVEGAEWQVLDSWYRLQNRTLPATQLLVEFHFLEGQTDVEAVVAPLFELLLSDGYRVFATEPNYYCGDGCCASKFVEYAFIKVSRHGHIVTGVSSHGSGLSYKVME